ncbi:MAG: hypothetical protein AAF614_28720 [Chloroflexota bacterium]
MKNRLSLLIVCGLILLGVACNEGGVAETAVSTATPQPAPTETAVPTRNPDALYIDASQSLGPINPLVYGSNYGPWLAVPVGVLEAYQNSGLTFLRFPGGRWGDENNIRDLQVDQLMTLTDMIDGEASISTRLLGGTPEESAEVVRYTNIEKEYNVRYWSIGNEPTLYATLQNSDEWNTAYFNQEWRKFAEAMKAVDPNILILGPEVHQYTVSEATDPKDANGNDWMREFLLANGDLVDVVTIHRYPFPKDMATPAPTPAELMANSPEWDVIIPKLRELIIETTGKELPIGVTEINSNWTNTGGGDTTPDSLLSAIWWADSLGRMIRNQVDMVNHFALQSKPGQAGWGLLARNDVRPGYYVYQLYKMFGTELLHADSPDGMLSVFAAQRDDGAITAIVINRSDAAKTTSLQIVGAATSETADLWRFDADHNAEALGETATDSVEIPPYSMSLFVFPSQ